MYKSLPTMVPRHNYKQLAWKNDGKPMRSKKSFWKIPSNHLFFHEFITAPHEDGDLHLDMAKKE
jgi:hypothetical protein